MEFPYFKYLPVILMLFVTSIVIFDIRSRRIPNVIVFPSLVVGILFNSLNGWLGFLFSIKGMLVGLLLLIVPYLFRAMGAGDVKFLAAIGSFVGASEIIRVLLLALLSYPLIAIVFLFIQRKFIITIVRFLLLLLNLAKLQFPFLQNYINHLQMHNDPTVASATTPFGLSIGIGTALSIFTKFIVIP